MSERGSISNPNDRDKNANFIAWIVRAETAYLASNSGDGRAAVKVRIDRKSGVRRNK
jgi:hypothetical protein